MGAQFNRESNVKSKLYCIVFDTFTIPLLSMMKIQYTTMYVQKVEIQKMNCHSITLSHQLLFDKLCITNISFILICKSVICISLFLSYYGFTSITQNRSTLNNRTHVFTNREFFCKSQPNISLRLTNITRNFTNITRNFPSQTSLYNRYNMYR